MNFIEVNGSYYGVKLYVECPLCNEINLLNTKVGDNCTVSLECCNCKGICITEPSYWNKQGNVYALKKQNNIIYDQNEVFQQFYAYFRYMHNIDVDNEELSFIKLKFIKTDRILVPQLFALVSKREMSKTNILEFIRDGFNTSDKKKYNIIQLDDKCDNDDFINYYNIDLLVNSFNLIDGYSKEELSMLANKLGGLVTFECIDTKDDYFNFYYKL